MFANGWDEVGDEGKVGVERSMAIVVNNSEGNRVQLLVLLRIILVILFSIPIFFFSCGEIKMNILSIFSSSSVENKFDWKEFSIAGHLISDS